MNPYLLLIICLTISSSLFARTEVMPFYTGSYDELQAAARTENRPYFVNFYTGWCSPCDRMNETTYADAELIEYVRRNYLAFTADAESFEDGGLELADAHQVLFYPTILIFSSKGELLHRTTGFKSAKSLKALLKAFRFYGETEGAPLASGTPKPASGSTPVVTPPAQQGPLGKGLYSISVSRQSSVGYGVQIGVFGDFANVLKTVQQLETDGYRDVLVHVDELKGKTVFRIVMGPFASRAKADTRKKQFKQKQGKDGLVVELNRFK